MQKSYECELATHIVPESCGAARKSGLEALTGERAGRVYSRVRTFLRDADAGGESGRPHRVHRRTSLDLPMRPHTHSVWVNEEVRAGCGKPACPDRWRGLWVIMISTPTFMM